MSLRPVLIHSCFDQSIGDLRPSKCRCRYRISLERAKEFVKQGKAQWLIVDYKNTVPVESWNLVWGRAPDEDEKETSGSYSKMTPRVETIEKTHMERAYVDGKKADIARINIWGQMSQEMLLSMIVPERYDPFKGEPILFLIGWDERSCVGKDVPHDSMRIDKTMQI